jgi:hypothetical protein
MRTRSTQQPAWARIRSGNFSEHDVRVCECSRAYTAADEQLIPGTQASLPSNRRPQPTCLRRFLRTCAPNLHACVAAFEHAPPTYMLASLPSNMRPQPTCLRRCLRTGAPNLHACVRVWSLSESLKSEPNSQNREGSTTTQRTKLAQDEPTQI